VVHRQFGDSSAPLERTRERRTLARPALVPRPRLMQRLDAVLDGGLACVVAPAGFGKTTAVRTWVLDHARSAASGSGELHLPDDARHPGVEPATPMLCRWWWHDATPDSRAEAFLPTLEPETAEHTGSAENAGSVIDVLVVDDAHLLRRSDLTRVLHWLRDNPERARLVLNSRWGQSREISQARLPEPPIELRAEDLRFSLAESRELLRLRVGPVSEGHEAALMERTSGWIAGLRLAAVGLEQAVARGRRGGEEPRAAAREFVSQFSGDDRAISDFLTVEVLSSMPHRDLAVLAAVCGRRTGPLFSPLAPIMIDPAEVLVRTQSLALRHHDAIETLNNFAENELFVLVSGGRWRLHPLLVATVRGLVATTPALITAAERGHAAAARWHASNARGVAALTEAVGSRQADLVADVLIEFGPELLLDPGSGTSVTLKDAFDVLGPAWRSERPQLLPISALWRLIERDPAGAVGRLEAAAVLEAAPRGEDQERAWGRARSDLAVARLWLARLGLAELGPTFERVARQVCVGDPAEGRLVSSEGLLRDSLLLTSLAETALCTGRFRAGAELLKAALRLTSATERQFGVPSAAFLAVDVRARGLALLCGFGDLRRFDELTTWLEERERTFGHPLAGTMINPMAAARLARAYVAFKDGDPHRAILELARADAGVPDIDPLFPAIRRASRAWMAVESRDPKHAVAAVTAEREGEWTASVPGWLAVVTAGAHIAAELQLAETASSGSAGFGAAGSGSTGSGSAGSGTAGSGSAGSGTAVTGLGDSLAALDTVDLAAPGVSHVLRLVTARVLPGVDGTDAELRAALVAAGTAVLPAEVLPTPTARPAPRKPASRAARAIRAATVTAATTATAAGKDADRVMTRTDIREAQHGLPEDLTPRELDVLRHLDGPAHYDDIAEELFLSRNTVKTHVKAVYRKLGVNGRVAAVRLAKELDLLDGR
jgi:LuxR family maltose regulon positive regulatory protein